MRYMIYSRSMGHSSSGILYNILYVEDLAWQDGFVKYDEKFPGQRTLADIDHCRVVLRWEHMITMVTS